MSYYLLHSDSEKHEALTRDTACIVLLHPNALSVLQLVYSTNKGESVPLFARFVSENKLLQTDSRQN